MNDLQKKLIEAAQEAAELAYAPYSKFRVGSAVLADGKVFKGANVENVSSNLGICAERVAILNALMHSAKNIDGIAVACVDADQDDYGNGVKGQSMPCGGCLQWIQEHAPGAWIAVGGIDMVYKLSDLLPEPFTKKRNT